MNQQLRLKIYFWPMIYKNWQNKYVLCSVLKLQHAAYKKKHIFQDCPYFKPQLIKLEIICTLKILNKLKQ